MRPLENTFSWSLSRSRTFEECPRRYWYHYYGAWGGWEPDAPAEVRELYLLKNLTNLHLIAGDVVHRAIERSLFDIHRGVDPKPERVVAWCKSEMQRAWAESRDEAWRDDPKKCTRFFEHQYGPSPSRNFLVKIAKKIGDSVRAFFGSEAFGIIRETDPAEWLPMETLDTFVFEGTTVYAVPDFACRHRGEVLLFDWKTGRADGRNHDQVVLYTMFAAAKWQVDPDAVRGAPVYLLDRDGAFEPEAVTPQDRERVADTMRRSIQSMRGRLVDPVTNTARMEDFETAPGQACRSCNFRGVCPDAR